MAISFIERKSGGAANAGSITLTFTSTATANDLILVMHCDGDTTDNAMPTPTSTGYTDVGTSEQYANGSSNDSNSRAWYKFANGTETNVILAGTGGGSNAGASACCMIFRGVALVADGGPFSTPVILTKGTGSSNPDSGSIATTAGDWVVTLGAFAAATAGTATAPTNYTTNAELGTAGVDTIDGKAVMAYRSAPANPENPGAWSVSGSAAGDSWTAITAALKEAPPPPAAAGTGNYRGFWG